MPKYLIEVDDIEATHWHTRADLKKMFANAVEAVEVDRESLVDNSVYGQEVDGQPVTLYAVVKEANNGKV